MQRCVLHSQFFQNAFPQLPDNVFRSIANGKHSLANFCRHIGLHRIQRIQLFYLPIELARSQGLQIK